MLIKLILMCIIGLASGIAIAGGIFAFITWLGLVTRFATRTQTASHILLYEDMVVLGAGIGNVLYLYEPTLLLGLSGLIAYGLFSGIFTGCLAVALAEVIQTFPVFARRANIRKGTPYILLALAIGKGIGTLIQVFF